MKVRFFEIQYHLFKSNTYIDLGTKEMSVIPQKDDVLKGKSLWRVVQRTFRINNEENGEDYVELYLVKANMTY